MSLHPNKANTLAAIITLMAACTISISAQTSAAVNILTVKPDSTRQTREAALEKKSGRPAEDPDMTARREEPAEINPGSDVTDPIAARAGTIAAAGAANARNEGHAATNKAVSASPQSVSSEKWQFQFSPYFWLASLHGTGGVGNRTVQVDESFSDIFHSLDFALMGVFEARKGKLIVLTDMEYVAISDDKATPGPFFSNVNAKFKTFIFDPEVGYRVLDNPAKGQSIDVLGGIRVWHVSTELNFGAGILPALQVQGSRNWVDAIVGLRGKMALSPKLFATGKFDLGGGGSKFTWQIFAGGGYNINEKIALIGGYRVLDVNYNKNNFVYDMNQRGPIMGLGFKF
jgi:opacity protein-like surface antigen